MTTETDLQAVQEETSGGRTQADGPNVPVGSEEARLTAAAVLEVLSGVISATDAATALGVDVSRYYVLEKRALAGMVLGCEPVKPGGGRRDDLEREVESLRKENKRLQGEAMRFEALARTAAMASGFNGEKAQKARKSPRRRTPPRGQKVSRSLRKKG